MKDYRIYLEEIILFGSNLEKLPCTKECRAATELRAALLLLLWRATSHCPHSITLHYDYDDDDYTITTYNFYFVHVKILM